jgi:hypothetical protein
VPAPFQEPQSGPFLRAVQLRIEKEEELDDNLTSWLQEAYDHRRKKDSVAD